MGRRKSPRTFKNIYTVKLIKHKLVTVEANSKQDVLDYFEPKGNTVPSIRTKVLDSDGEAIRSKTLKTSFKVMTEKLTDAEVLKRERAKFKRIEAQIPCRVCDEPKTSHEYYGESWSRPCPKMGTAGDGYYPKYSVEEWLAKK